MEITHVGMADRQQRRGFAGSFDRGTSGIHWRIAVHPRLVAVAHIVRELDRQLVGSRWAVDEVRPSVEPSHHVDHTGRVDLGLGHRLDQTLQPPVAAALLPACERYLLPSSSLSTLCGFL